MGYKKNDVYIEMVKFEGIILFRLRSKILLNLAEKKQIFNSVKGKNDFNYLLINVLIFRWIYLLLMIWINFSIEGVKNKGF